MHRCPTLRGVLLFVLSLALGSCTVVLLAEGRNGEAWSLSPDGHTLSLYGKDGEEVASVDHVITKYSPTLTVDRIDVKVDSSRRFQFATETSAGYRPGASVTRESIDISATALRGKEATHSGWRDLQRVDDYSIPVTSMVGYPREDGCVFVIVRTDPSRSGFLIVVVTVRKEASSGNQP